MEQQSQHDQELAVEASWLPLSLRDGGVPCELLFNTYDEIYRSRVRVYQAGLRRMSANCLC